MSGYARQCRTLARGRMQFNKQLRKGFIREKPIAGQSELRVLKRSSQSGAMELPRARPCPSLPKLGDECLGLAKLRLAILTSSSPGGAEMSEPGLG